MESTNPTKLDRKSLKASIFALRDAGVKVKYDKTESSDQLTARLNTALNTLPTPELVEKLGRIDPEKLKVVSGDGACLGLFIDMRQPECQICTDRDACIKQYMKNLDGNLTMFKNAMVDLKTEAIAKTVTDEDAEATVKKSKSEKDAPKRMKYDASMSIYVMDIPNPVSKKKEPDAFALIKDILDDVPTSLGALRKLVNTHFEYESDRDFMEELFKQLLDYGVVKLWDDLTGEQRRAYKAAKASSD